MGFSRFSARSRPRPLHVALGVLFAAWVCGCETSPRPPIGPALTIVPADRVVFTSDVPALEGATAATWAADPQRLSDDVHRAIRRCHWGVLSHHVHTPAKEGDPVIRVSARALLPNDLEADIHAWSSGENLVTAVVRIGRFGEPHLQSVYLEQLAATLADKPKPQRYRYRLPD
jgi:hypothetical protein